MHTYYVDINLITLVPLYLTPAEYIVSQADFIAAESVQIYNQ
jgi:hypothetical protein